MRHRSFGDFVNKKKREAVRQLGIVKMVLEHNSMKVDSFLDTGEDDDPYIYCHNPSKNGSFDGIRLYKVGDTLAFRIQKENKTHPYGAAYPLPIEDMFQDFLSDHGVDEKKAGTRIIEAVGHEIRRFFEKSIEAERDERSRDLDKSGTGDVLLRSTGTDYSALVNSKA